MKPPTWPHIIGEADHSFQGGRLYIELTPPSFSSDYSDMVPISFLRNSCWDPFMHFNLELELMGFLSLSSKRSQLQNDFFRNWRRVGILGWQIFLTTDDTKSPQNHLFYLVLDSVEINSGKIEVLENSIGFDKFRCVIVQFAASVNYCIRDQLTFSIPEFNCQALYGLSRGW